MQSSGMENLRRYIVARREELNISQEELARRSGLPRPTIGAIESGRVDNSPRIDTLDKLAKGLNVPFERLALIARGFDPDKPKSGPEWTNEDVQRLVEVTLMLPPERQKELIDFAKFRLSQLEAEEKRQKED